MLRKLWFLTKSLVLILLLVLSGIDFVPLPARAAGPEQPVKQISVAGEQDDAPLTEAEKAWLAKHPNIRLGIDPNWMPFEALTSEGLYEGISSGYVALLNSQLGINMRPVSDMTWDQVMEGARKGDIDVIPCITPTPKRSEVLSFTKPYISFPNVVLTRNDAPAITGLQDLEGAKVAVVKGYAVQEYMEREFPKIRLLKVQGTMEGLDAVLGGDVSAYVDNEAVIRFYIRKLGLEDLKIAASTQLSNKLAFGVRKDWPDLVAILDKALSSIPVEERARIETRWVNIHFEERTDWGFILWMGMGASAVMSIIFGIIFFWNRRLAREVTQRKQAEMRFQAMAANVPGAIFQIRVLPDGGRQYEYLSPGSEQFFGVSTEEIIQGHRQIDVHPDDLARYEQAFAQAAAGEADLEFVGRLLTPDDELKWFRISGKPINDENPGLLFNGLILDITQRKLSEQEYLESEQKINAMSQAIKDALIMIDSKGRVAFWNRAAEDIFGYTAEEVIGMDFHDMSVLPADRDMAHKGLAHFAATGQGAVIGTTSELQAKKKSGQTVPVEVSVASVKVQNEWHAVGVVRDISRRRQDEALLRESEEHTRLLLESAGEGIFGVNVGGLITFINTTALSMLGYSEEELIGKPVHELIHHHYPDGSVYPVEKCPMYLSYAEGVQHRIRGEMLWRKDGTGFFVEYTATPIRRYHSVTGAVVTFLDITTQKDGEKEIKEKYEELARFRRLAVGREKKMIELKKEINEFLLESGRKAKYKIVTAQDSSLRKGGNDEG